MFFNRVKTRYNKYSRRTITLIASSSAVSIIGSGYIGYNAFLGDNDNDRNGRNENIVLCDSRIHTAYSSNSYTKQEYNPTHSIPCRDGTFVVFVLCLYIFIYLYFFFFLYNFDVFFTIFYCGEYYISLIKLFNLDLIQYY